MSEGGTKTNTCCVKITAMHKASGEKCDERNWTSLEDINVCAPAQSCRSAAASFMDTEHAGHEELVDLMASGENVPRAGNTNGAKASFLIAAVSSTRRTANVQERTDRNRTRTCSSMPQLSQACHRGAKPNRHDRYRGLQSEFDRALFASVRAHGAAATHAIESKRR